ncbi:PEP-CTERM sorting domain-containing protein [Massilia sp. YMA4]|uniref:PEP-CTERM sorting domain-containing protein n=1 Tax=Massilia sp. YMA4 TaxID=1593482 RepID=UPI001D0C0DA5|nr:PEP-CTERM sorting domain-containing protein [Massilia sp. YMA4]
MKRFAALSLALAALSSGAVQAASSVATLSDYGFRLVDLNPYDGIAPSITFTSAEAHSYAGVAPIAGEGLTQTDYASSAWYGDVSAQSSARGAKASSSVIDGKFTSRGAVEGEGQFYANTQWGANFTLSAHTKLIFTGTASASYAGFGADYPNDYGSAYLSVTLLDNQATGPYNQVVHYSGGAYSYVPVPVDTMNERVRLEFFNNGDTDLYGRFNVDVGAAGTIAPVPEPATYAMLVAGLLLTTAVARRRKQG